MLKYTKHSETFCTFKGADLKAAMEVSGINAFNLSNAISVYPSKVQAWMKSKTVTVDKTLMNEINYILDNPLLIK